MISNNLFIQRFNGAKGTRNNNCYISPLFSERYTYRYNNTIAKKVCTPFLWMCIAEIYVIRKEICIRNEYNQYA